MSAFIAPWFIFQWAEADGELRQTSLQRTMLIFKRIFLVLLDARHHLHRLLAANIYDPAEVWTQTAQADGAPREDRGPSILTKSTNSEALAAERISHARSVASWKTATLSSSFTLAQYGKKSYSCSFAN